MNKYADLEIALSPEGEKYRVEMQLSLPGSDAPSGLTKAALAQFDTDALNDLEGQPKEYGKVLSRSLFTVEEAKEAGAFFQTARDVAAATGATLRVRLKIPPTAPALHPVRWETLRDPRPETEAFLFTDGRTPFSRFLTSDDLRPVETRPREDLKALVVIANPTDLKSIWKLAEVKVADVLKHAREGLKDIPLHALCRLDEGDAQVSGVEVLGLPTLDNLGAHLYSRYDILYLVCHGKLETQAVKGDGTRRVAQVWLERKDGSTDLVLPYEHTEKESGQPRAGLVDRIRHLPQLPRLVVLASCQSFGGAEESASPHGGALAALGPLLTEVGVPAVIAMQGNVKVATLEQFMPAFFEQLLRKENEGQIDLAMAAARAQVAGHRPDWWAPTLFMRLKSGRIGWYEPQFAGEDPELPWDGLCTAIKLGDCLPVLGPGLIESLTGPLHRLAEQWADADKKRPFPMAAHRRHSLYHVAQYLATMQQNPWVPASWFQELVSEEMQRHHDQKLESVPTAGKDPYDILARLPFDIYVTTNPDDRLFDALKAANRHPRHALFRWDERHILEAHQLDPEFSKEPKERTYIPSREEPLVYHLFGHWSQPKSMVVSEDSYFQYLIAVAQDRRHGTSSLIPLEVSSAWSSRALMFLGFPVDDWAFRVLLHSMVDYRHGSQVDGRPASLAVQVSPGGDVFANLEGARKYLETYLANFHGVTMNAYWGDVDVFLRKLWDRRKRWTPPTPPKWMEED